MDVPKYSDIMVSVIVPVYNSEMYLKRCIESICSQTHKVLQILLINDGSTDSSGLICETYAAIDGRIECFEKENGGVSSARNLGLRKVRGEFIVFVDSDDYIDEHMIERIVARAIDSNADLLIHGLVHEIENSKLVSITKCKEFLAQKEFDKMDALVYLQNCGLFGYACNKIYRSSLILSHHITYPEDVSLYEDLLFNIECFRYSKVVCGMNLMMYHYVQRSGSLSSSYNKEHMLFTEKVLKSFSVTLKEFTLNEPLAIELLFKFAFASTLSHWFSLGYRELGVIGQHISRLHLYQYTCLALKNGAPYVHNLSVFSRLCYRAMVSGRSRVIGVLLLVRRVLLFFRAKAKEMMK